MSTKYKTLNQLAEAYRKGEFKKYEYFSVVVDNDCVRAVAWPEGYLDDEDDEIEPVYLWEASGPRGALHEAMEALGIPSEDC